MRRNWRASRPATDEARVQLIAERKGSRASGQRTTWMMTAADQVPKYLYKYRALGAAGSDERGFIKQLFTEHKVHFSSRLSFNDPFDCRVYADLSGTETEWKNWFERMLEKESPQQSRQEREATARAWIQEGRHCDPANHRRSLEGAQQKADRLAIYCVTSERSSLAMWGHYADGHRGLCLEFAHAKDLFPSLQNRAAQPVTYQEVLSQPSFLRDSPVDLMTANLLTKSSEWQYEKEHRFIDTDDPPGLRRFSSQFLTGVIFGWRMPEEDRKAVLKWIQEGPTQPKLFEAHGREGEYAVDIRELAVP